MQILQEWVTGGGKYPFSWQTLIGVLRDLEPGTLADDIKVLKQHDCVVVQNLIFFDSES